MSKRKNNSSGDRPTADNRSPVVRAFPGPANATAPLRVSLSKTAWADLIAHARESLDAEVCGVLVGNVCEDGQGLFVDVRATIRGNAAREARAHVTFTHETWNQIHEELDRRHAGLQIVGWYHTHPGFGVEFSAMDRFIQENFFSAKTQVAFLSDPLGSDVALAYNGDGAIDYLTRFWVDGREHAANVPAGASAVEPPPGASAAAGSGGDFRREMERLEARVNQLVQSLDEQQRNFYRMLTTLVVVGCLGVIATVGYFIWTDRNDHLKPPTMQSYVPVPVKIGNETVMIGVGVVDWNVPKSLDAYLDKLARIEVEEQRRQEQELIEKIRQQQKKQEAPRKP